MYMLHTRRYGVALVGVRPAELPEFYEDTILLNPGPRHIMKRSDTCYYMSITKEENSSFTVANQQFQAHNLALGRKLCLITGQAGDSKPTKEETATTIKDSSKLANTGKSKEAFECYLMRPTNTKMYDDSRTPGSAVK